MRIDGNNGGANTPSQATPEHGYHKHELSHTTISMTDAEAAPNQEEFTATDQCVMCGLCLPHCPTYAESDNEADSPRGRISLIQAMARGELPADRRLSTHLEGCLSCRACEDVCPSGVPYGRLIDNARTELRRRVPPNPMRDALRQAFAAHRTLRRTLYAATRLARLSGLWSLAKRLGIQRLPGLGRLHALTGRLPAAHLSFDAVGRDSNPAVYLFTGCAAEIFDRETLEAARRVLLILGYRVLTPEAQTCCGALHQHAGDRQAAQALARANFAAFDNDIPILVTSSACATTLREYDTLLGAKGQLFGQRVHEIGEFLSATPWPEALEPRPLAQRAAVHTPCSQRRVLHAPDVAFTLLQHIPQLELTPLPGNDRCCGAAGSYMIEHPQMADALAAPKVRAAADLAPELLITTNIGCAMHLARALAEDGQTIEVVHPVTLLARQLAGMPPRA
ncbi:MAG: (Fe-S)-binding protein [Acidihalobacter sp.]